MMRDSSNGMGRIQKVGEQNTDAFHIGMDSLKQNARVQILNRMDGAGFIIDRTDAERGFLDASNTRRQGQYSSPYML
jgi:hypothetical protein